MVKTSAWFASQRTVPMLIVSILVGEKKKTDISAAIRRVYEAPKITDATCVFFTNDASMREEIERKGWRCEILNPIAFPLYPADSCESSLQSKYVKFLRFLNDYEEFAAFSRILYFDHKMRFTAESVSRFVSLLSVENAPSSSASVLVRETPPLKTSVWDEVRASENMRRYALAMPATKDFVRTFLRENAPQVSESVRVCNTGSILYVFDRHVDARKTIRRFTDSIYDTIMRLGQPECQIFWCLFAQKYEGLVKTVPFNAVSVEWRSP